jgi:hypothetical protein
MNGVEEVHSASAAPAAIATLPGLPVEIVSLILERYLSLIDVYHMRFVCRGLHRIAQELLEWRLEKTLVIDGSLCVFYAFLDRLHAIYGSDSDWRHLGLTPQSLGRLLQRARVAPSSTVVVHLYTRYFRPQMNPATCFALFLKEMKPSIMDLVVACYTIQQGTRYALPSAFGGFHFSETEVDEIWEFMEHFNLNVEQLEQLLLSLPLDVEQRASLLAD